MPSDKHNLRTAWAADLVPGWIAEMLLMTFLAYIAVYLNGQNIATPVSTKCIGLCMFQ